MSDKEEKFDFDDEFEDILGDETPGDDEFSLEDDEATDELTSDTEKKKGEGLSSIIDMVKANLLYIVLGAIGAGFALWMIIGILFPSTPQQQRPQEQNRNFGLSTQSVQQAQPTPHVVQHSKTATTMPSNSFVIDKSEMQHLLTGFRDVVEKENTDIEKQISSLKSSQDQINKTANKDIQVVARQLVEITKSLKEMQGQINSTTDAMSKQKELINKVTNTLNETKQQLQLLIAQKAANMQKLTLRAVVPGRAWLVDGAGNTISVGVGDALPYYGKVVKVDSAQGSVVMSSGYTFK